MYEIYSNKTLCTACGACVNKCPKDAIFLQYETGGGYYPIIDQGKCIDCHLCIRICPTHKQANIVNPLEVYATALCDKEKLKKSASGGLFAALSKTIIEQGGIVFGASYVDGDEGLEIHHIGVENLEDIYLVQGSKYVMSFIGDSYQKVREYLQNGRRVLFTGTPCQVAGLNAYLEKDYPNLVVADIVCHGVPDQQLFKDYLKCLGAKNSGKVIKFNFRDKKFGWGLVATAVIESGSRIKQKTIPYQLSSYYKNFIEGNTYRESCYSCPYATDKRISDITMGDFWGIYSEQPSVLIEYGGTLIEEEGISCALINTTKGAHLFEESKTLLSTYISTLEKVKRNNGQLNSHSVKTAEYEKVMTLYSTKGYTALEQYFWNKEGKVRLYVKVFKRQIYIRAKRIIPINLKRKLKKILKKA